MTIIPRKILPAPAKTTQSAASRNRQVRTPSRRKTKLVDLGAVFLARGEMSLVAAVTKVIEKRGWRHA